MPFTLAENVLVKCPLPDRGIVCSNPQRATRLVNRVFAQPKVHTDAWGLVIYTGALEQTELFIASVPMGAGGSGFAFLELYAAGAKYLVRYGSNDRYVNEKNLKDIILVHKADNLVGLMRDAGLPETQWGTSLIASPLLLNHFRQTAAALDLNLTTRRCHHIEDYHAYNYPELTSYQARIEQRIKTLETEPCAWDMETAALYYRAQQFNQHGLTLLQSLIKHRGTPTAYEGTSGAVSLTMEQTFQQLILTALTTLNN